MPEIPVIGDGFRWSEIPQKQKAVRRYSPGRFLSVVGIDNHPLSNIHYLSFIIYYLKTRLFSQCSLYPSQKLFRTFIILLIVSASFVLLFLCSSYTTSIRPVIPVKNIKLVAKSCRRWDRGTCTVSQFLEYWDTVDVPLSHPDPRRLRSEDSDFCFLSFRYQKT